MGQGFFERYAQLEKLLARDGYHTVVKPAEDEPTESSDIHAILKSISTCEQISAEARLLASELAAMAFTGP